MKMINLVLLSIIILVLFFAFCSHEKDSESLVVVPTRQYCTSCGQLNAATCSTCSNCGFCVTADGVGQCVEGDINGPLFRQDCQTWNPPTSPAYVYDYGLPYYGNYYHNNSNYHWIGRDHRVRNDHHVRNDHRRRH